MKRILLLLVLVFSFGSALGQYVVDFEGSGETKTGYASGNVTLNGISWNITEGLIGTSASDFSTGSRSLRMRSTGTPSFMMNANKANGLGVISFQYRRYGTDAQADWRVEYSINDGTNWTQAGSNFTAPSSNTVQTFTATINITGNVRIRIVRASGTGSGDRRLNIDDIELTDYTLCNAPSMSSQPSTSTAIACIGTSFPQLSVTASGTNPTYQWYINTTASNSGGTSISGATSSTYTPLNDWGTGARYFYAIVSGCSTSVTSNVSGAQTALAVPSIPNGSFAYSPNPACGPVSVTYTYGSGEPNTNTYYWQTSATGVSTSFPVSSPYSMSSGGTIFVRAYNGSCWSTASSSMVTVNTPPTISTQPNTSNANTCVGTAFGTLSVTASGTSLSYQWYKSTDNSNATPGDDVTVGTNSASFTPSNSEIGTFYYYVIVSGASPCPPVTSNVSGARTVNAIPATPQGTITPTSSCGPTTLTYNFASGESTDGNTYYWQTVSGAQSTSNPVSSPFSRTISGTVYVNSRNASGCWSNQISQAITISTQPSFSTQPTNQTVAAGSTATFTTNGTSFGSYTRQWQESTDGGLTWNNVGTNSNSLPVANATLSQNQNRYKVIVTNGSCVVESNVAILTVNNLSPNNATELMACFASTEVDLRWTAPSTGSAPTGYIVFALPNATVPQMANAGDANTYIANSNYSLATTHGTLGRVVYKGNATSATITGLTNASEYTFKVVSYIGETQTGWATAITASGSWNQTYTIAIPNVTNVAATTAATSSSISFNVIPSSSVCNYEYVVVANQGTVTFVPSGDGSAYTVNNVYAGGNQVIYKGNGLSNATITGLTEGTTYCYKVFVRRGTEWSSGVEVCATATLTYCSSNSTVTDPSGITAVNFNTINQTSASTSTYTNYTSVSTTVELGESYPLSVRVNTDGNFSIYTRVWIDWNRNGSFEASELYETGFATDVPNGLTNASPFTVNVPMDAAIGNVRMRVSAKSVLNETTPTSCETFQYGEVEDYTINVTRPVGPEIALRGGTNPILSGSTTANALNQTLFAIQEIGTTSTAKEYTIFSIGTASLSLTGSPAVLINGANASDFSVTEQPASSIATGATSTFKITFTPSGPGTRTATVSIANNDTTGNENPFTFVIQGTGKSPEIDVQGGGISIPSGSSVVSVANNTNFGTSQVTGGLVQKTFNILNTGSDILTVSNPVISGSTDFTITANPATSVAINGTTAFTVTFNPSSTGPKNAIVVIANNDLNENPYTFAIQGYGVDYVECGLGDEEIIAQQDFETSPATPVWGMTLPASNVHAIRGNDPGATFAGPVYIDARSFQVFNNVNGTVLAFDAVNTSAVTDVNLSFRVGAFYRNTTSQGLDVSDNVSVEISTDGNNWSREIQINGNDNARWSFTSGTAIANKVYTGNNTATIFGPSAGGDRTTDGYSTVNLTGLPKVQNLYVRIILRNNETTELWAIDNVILKGKREAVKTWNGSQWRNGAGVVTTPPIASDAVIINGNYSTTAGNLAGCKCQVNTGYTVTVIAGTNMVIESDIKNDGIIDIKDDGSLVQKNDFAENSGDIKYERIAEPMYRYDYTYWSSPVASQTLGDLSPLTLADKYFKWDTNYQDWTNVLRADEMVQGLGYIIRAPQTFSTNPLAPEEFTGNFEGAPNNGVITVSVEGSNSAQKWNLLGNPYPSAISADKFLDIEQNPDLDGTIYVWTHNTPLDPVPNSSGFYSYAPNDYAVYNGLGGTATTPGAAVYEGYIASGQGFFVKGNTNGTATFNNQMRVTNRNTQFLRNPISNRNTPEKNRIWLNLSDSQNAFKQILIGYIDEATNGIDRKFDGEILGSNALMFYSVVSEKTLAIQGRALPFDTNDKVDLGYKTIAAGNLKVSLSNLDGLFTDQNIYLEDKTLNIIHDLKQSDYTFASAIGTFDNRFVIRFTNQTLSNPDFDLNSNNIGIGVKDKTVTVKSSIESIQKIKIYDLLGRVIYDNKNVNSKEITINELSASNQTLVVKIYLENGSETSKKIIVN